MKSKSIAAIAIAAAVLVFAFYQFSKTKEQKPFLIAGEWRGDSIYSVSKIDTSLSLFGIDMLQLADKRVLVFNADSTITDVFKMKDSASAKYYLRDSVIFIDEGKGLHSLHSSSTKQRPVFFHDQRQHRYGFQKEIKILTIASYVIFFFLNLI
jgi:hypothetical protein